MSLQPRVPLAPPAAIVSVARETMGGIDLDGYGDSVLSPMIGARQYRLPEEPLVWEPPGEGRVFASVLDGGMPTCRQLFKTLRAAWMRQDVKEAMVYTTNTEIIRHCPWIWDQPLMTCIPFRRQAPRFFCDELETLLNASPGSWGFLLYLPRESRSVSCRARFYGAAGRIGRVIEVGAQPADWEEGYLACTGKPYDHQLQ
jgi:hypothetical protein